MNNKNHYFHDENQNIQISEGELPGKTLDELYDFLGNYEMQKIHPNECIFIIKKYFWGIVSLKLHLYLSEGVVLSYCIKY
ncbi:hypothetical protein [Chryseobacterium sp. BIGb0232]|uniref:hypothetical protein n=1 Tax=Chryseobacterium sp. BIGb0232 TaxID=2940598 RepID=UPI000F494368|nr:hypothetical protein [Chryseobacterium sp. BIGb0232]MCS4301178.1 hypothetical protein [Chryseobacterium sp. BIGb0232]ROS19961.1 hypothetical protein EDF65_0661 [Chryseobacterium nakagawai]